MKLQSRHQPFQADAASAAGDELAWAALEKVKPFALDVSSGVETDGFKDPAKIREFIRMVRNG